ncbi:uncharacterized protein A1O5_08683 [Cladophialophora psammophila CBS 110553]|uniref:Protein YTP1-like C-terminal domain-containing protein n=1 Tax=Cladophialophora psammophila CBS 110553 TaxID=1182543 RepID=W9WJH5_9EURO|nr:uncharacterized protein A1O5_08683 [Cladophialophora psammophila CBS 110553]EXJ68068.1 hypothetical protein A1O5_08683 [Cladophialophora psammophila CBS 110553]
MLNRYVLAVILLEVASLVAAHEVDEAHEAGIAGVEIPESAASNNATRSDLYSMSSYAGLSEQSSVVIAHIVLMFAAWFFVLPIGVMFSIARSRLGFFTQSIFIPLNSLGVLLGIIYNDKTPDLYQNNAHHTIGWIATWVTTVHAALSLVFFYAGQHHSMSLIAAGRAAFFPLTRDRRQASRAPRPCSGRHGSAIALQRLSEDSQKSDFEDIDDDDESPVRLPCRPNRLGISFLNRFLGTRLSDGVLPRLMGTLKALYDIVDRTVLVLGFLALVTGGVTYTGIFRGNHIFNGLAHFMKGGIFFWYGLLTLGRWMGCFAEYGWAWNMGSLTSSAPSAEFVECFCIFLYGLSNMFLEHLAAWGGAWTAQDLEHVSISMMFFGGGLCGLLVESKKIRKWLDTTIIESARIHDNAPGLPRPSKVYNYSTNPMPALIILLLGLMMSSHHQSSVVSTTVHKQWGMLLVGFSVMRMLTYIVMYISPPDSVYASRPPSELVASFCLISGGIVFMASTKDIVHWMEEANLMGMFIFTVAMGLTAFIMAYEILVLSLKGWVARRELRK